ncbi:hypothetical protein Q5P01_014572 [Channa striata]|uniref:Uncharacterized protein n=1 Tax=Channa striata TaxID=64152 RepID=A0AA88MHH7_CHASR|nr:hypothetical protein Q5P01_014572 [Channa striata]
MVTKMNKLPSILLLLCGPLAQCLPVTSGGNTFLQVFFCSDPGCAANVTNIFCNDKPLSSVTPLTECTDLPPPNSVCQHDGRAFVSINTTGTCEFERGYYMNTEKCTDQTSVCNFTSATTQSLANTKKPQGPQRNHICSITAAGLALVSLILVVVLKRGLQSRGTSARDTQDDEQSTDEHNSKQHRTAFLSTDL